MTRQTEARLAVARPLYTQVRDLLLERIRNSEWSIGQALPNEFNLAAEFGVSIGTVRRAVEGLEETGIVVRKQGRGTYLAGPGSTTVLGRFMPMRLASGEPVACDYALVRTGRRTAIESERQALGLHAAGDVIEVVQRVRAGQAVRGVERSVVPAGLFPRPLDAVGLDRHLYFAYAELGVFVTQAEDRVTALAADAAGAGQLDVSVAAPVLAIERIAYALDGRPIELRSSLFALTGAAYHGAFGQDTRT